MASSAFWPCIVLSSVPVELRRQRPLLGCFVEIGVRARSLGAQRSVTRAFDQVELVHRLLSFHNPDSDLSRLNRASGSEVVLHPIAAHVLHLACKTMQASGGLFNCTVGGELVSLRRLPEIVSAPVVDVGEASDIQLCGRRARLVRPVLITLDGIAKGYAVDLAVASLERDGIDAGWVNAGGDMRVFGELRIPVHRRELDGRLVAIGELGRGAIATSRVDSGIDARFPGMIVGSGKAKPARGLWTVLARRAWLADALTKIAALASVTERSGLLERLGARLLPAC